MDMIFGIPVEDISKLKAFMDTNRIDNIDELLDMQKPDMIKAHNIARVKKSMNHLNDELLELLKED